jgi:hypothetical protein
MTVDNNWMWLRSETLPAPLGNARLESHDSPFQSISIEELNAVPLLNRYDSKYLIPLSKFPAVLQQLAHNYKILKIAEKTAFRYHTRYFDDHLLNCYLAHHNSRPRRFKIRIRHYLDTGRVFDEIKFKTNKKSTHKARIERTAPHSDIDASFAGWLETQTEIDVDSLTPSLDVYATRSTFVNRAFTERVTIDHDVRWTRRDKTIEALHFVVLEIKHSHKLVRSDGFIIMKRLGFRPISFSKYCIGIALLEPAIKQGRFRGALRRGFASDLVSAKEDYES